MQHDPPNDLDPDPAAAPAHLTRIQAIRDQITDLKKRWPAHSTPPNLMHRLDELEDQLETELALEPHPLGPEKPSTLLPPLPAASATWRGVREGAGG